MYKNVEKELDFAAELLNLTISLYNLFFFIPIKNVFFSSLGL